MQITSSLEHRRVPITVLKPEGPLNMSTSSSLEKKAGEAYSAGGRYLLIDLNGVTSLTSAGLRAILSISRLYAHGEPENEPGEIHKHRCLKLLNPSPQINSVLNIAGFDHFLDIFQDFQAALDSF